MVARVDLFAACVLPCVACAAILAEDELTFQSSGHPGDGGTFDPSQLPGIALWLRGEGVVADSSNAVREWHDESGHHNDARPAGPSAPELVASGLHDHGVVRFHGASTHLAISDSPTLVAAGPKSFVLAAVVTYPAQLEKPGVVFERLADQVGPLLLVFGNASRGTSFSAQVVPDVGSGVFAPFPPGATTGTTRVIVQWTPDVKGPGGTLSVKVGRSSPATRTITTTPPEKAAVAYVGADLVGDIAELLLVAGPAIDSADVAKLETYLDARYGL